MPKIPRMPQGSIGRRSWLVRWHSVGMDKWEAPDETSFWLGVGESGEIVGQARAEVSEGQGLTQEQIRAEFGKPNPSA